LARSLAVQLAPQARRQGMVAQAVKVGERRYRESYGRCYEDFVVGDVYEHRPGRTITEADNIWFTLLTMNQHPLHFDREYARQSEFGQPIVNSALTLAIVTGMSVSDVSQKAIANLGWTDIRMPAPVFNGDTLYAESEVLDKRPQPIAADPGDRHHRDPRPQSGRHAGHGVQAHDADPHARPQR
jgi:itaconyl-CoA hydratase